MFADAVDTIWTSRNDYERRAHEVSFHSTIKTSMLVPEKCPIDLAQLITSIQSILAQWSESRLSSAYAEAKKESHDFALYKKTLKRQWVGQKADLAGLLGNITTKLKTYDMRLYVPPSGLSLTVSDIILSLVLSQFSSPLL